MEEGGGQIQRRINKENKIFVSHIFSLSQQGILLQLSLWLCVILVVIKLSVKSVMQRLKEPGSSLHPRFLS